MAMAKHSVYFQPENKVGDWQTIFPEINENSKVPLFNCPSFFCTH